MMRLPVLLIVLVESVVIESVLISTVPLPASIVALVNCTLLLSTVKVLPLVLIVPLKIAPFPVVEPCKIFTGSVKAVVPLWVSIPVPSVRPRLMSL